MKKQYSQLRSIGKLLDDYRMRILIIIAAFGLFMSLLAALESGVTYKAVYYDSSDSLPDGIILVETEKTVSVSAASVPVDMENAVDINTASAEELAEALPGIGEKKALAIIEYREITGGFSSVDELVEVNGIGEKLLEKIRPYCYVSEVSVSDVVH